MAASTSQDVELITVLIDNDDGAKVKAYKLSADTSVEDLKRRWSDEVGAHADAVVLTTSEGTVLNDSWDLNYIGTPFAKRKSIQLISEITPEKALVDVDIYKCPRERTKVVAFPTQLPEELHPAIRSIFNIDEKRLFRLRTLQSPLKYNLTLRDQGVTADTRLFVDLAVRLVVLEPWSNTVEHLLKYSSENCKELTCDDSSHSQRLTLNKWTLDTNNEVIDALMPFGSIQRNLFSLELHVKKELTVLTHRNFKERLVWPRDRLDQVIPCSARVKLPWMVCGQLVSISDQLCDIDLADNGLLHGEIVNVGVTLSNGRHQLIRVPHLGTVSDVREAVRVSEDSELFSLKHKGRVLVNDQRIDEVALQDGDSVEVQRIITTVTVTLSDRCVRWSTENQSIRFTDLVYVLARKSGLDYERLIHKVFQCTGCKRQLTKAEEDFQPIPAPCCRIRSLQIKEVIATPTSDAETQGLCHSRGQPPSHKSVDVQLESVVPIPLYLRNDSGSDMTICPLLPEPVRVGAVRAAVAREMGVEPLRVRMERRMGSRDGVDVGEVCDEVGYRKGFANGDEDVIDWLPSQVRPLHHDDAIFPSAAGHRSLVSVTALRYPATSCPLWLQNEGRPNCLISPLLPDPVTVGDVRREVASELGIHPGRVKLLREVGTSVEGVECVRVSESDDDRHFGDAAGHIWDEDELRRWGERELHCNDDRFMTIASRRCHVFVSIRDAQAVRYRLYLRNRNGPNAVLEPLLPRPAKARDIRKLAAEKLRIKPERVKLHRRMGTIDRKVWVEVCDGDDASTDGSLDDVPFESAGSTVRLRKTSLSRMRRRPIEDEEEIYPTDGLSVIEVSQDASAVRRPLYFRNANGPDFKIAPELPDPVLVRNVRALAASEMGLAAERVVVERWFGRWYGRECVQICGVDGEVVDGNTRGARFEGEDGMVGMLHLRNVHRCILHDDDVFLSTSKRSVVLVSRRD